MYDKLAVANLLALYHAFAVDTAVLLAAAALRLRIGCRLRLLIHGHLGPLMESVRFRRKVKYLYCIRDTEETPF